MEGTFGPYSFVVGMKDGLIGPTVGTSVGVAEGFFVK